MDMEAALDSMGTLEFRLLREGDILALYDTLCVQLLSMKVSMKVLKIFINHV